MTSYSQAAKAEKRFCFPWMASREFDLLWFFAPLFIGLAALYVLNFPAMAAPGLLFLFVVNAFGIGPMHQGPTWFFYFDKSNNKHWTQDSKRVLIYYVGPVLVGVISVFLQIAAPWLALLITTLWGIQHFNQQNLGVVLLYHNKNGNEALPDRKLLSRSLWTPSIFFISVFFYRLLAGTGPVNPWLMGAFVLTGLVALFDVSRYLLGLYRQLGTGARINVPALVFWAISVLYFVPFTWPGQRVETAFLIPGTLHWCQYIGLNLILIRHKYQDEQRKFDIPFSAQALMAVLCFGSLAIYLATHASKLHFDSDSVAFRFCLGLGVAMSNIHYYQDAYFWRFREQFQRDSIMPYLLKARQIESRSE